MSRIPKTVKAVASQPTRRGESPDRDRIGAADVAATPNDDLGAEANKSWPTTSEATDRFLKTSAVAAIRRAEELGRPLLDPSQSATRARLRALGTDTDPDGDELTAMAHMFVRADGGSLRTFSGGLSHECGWWPSYKRGRVQHWEGITARYGTLLAECDPDIEWAQTEARRFEFILDGKRHRYTADQEQHRIDGSIRLVEYKRDARDLSDAGYRTTLAAVAEICRRCCIEFAIVYRDELFANRFHRANVELFSSRRFARVGDEHVRRLETLALKHGHGTSYGDLAAALEPNRPMAGKAVLQALLIRRRILIDLTSRIDDDTPVTIL